ncbi:hypothetical protein JOD21_000891 [Jeotgalibacillus terrae]|nr:hypothetical protein [Jeotgalibacillus terrae]
MINQKTFSINFYNNGTNETKKDVLGTMSIVTVLISIIFS